MYFATNYFPLTEKYFEKNLPFLHQAEAKRPIVGIHIFKWDPEVSYLKIKTFGGSEVNFTGGSLVEGAIYWVGVTEVIEAGIDPTTTEVWGIISTFKQI